MGGGASVRRRPVNPWKTYFRSSASSARVESTPIAEPRTPDTSWFTIPVELWSGDQILSWMQSLFDIPLARQIAPRLSAFNIATGVDFGPVAFSRLLGLFPRGFGALELSWFFLHVGYLKLCLVLKTLYDPSISMILQKVLSGHYQTPVFRFYDDWRRSLSTVIEMSSSKSTGPRLEPLLFASPISEVLATALAFLESRHFVRSFRSVVEVLLLSASVPPIRDFVGYSKSFLHLVPQLVVMKPKFPPDVESCVGSTFCHFGIDLGVKNSFFHWTPASLVCKNDLPVAADLDLHFLSLSRVRVTSVNLPIIASRLGETLTTWNRCRTFSADSNAVVFCRDLCEALLIESSFESAKVSVLESLNNVEMVLDCSAEFCTTFPLQNEVFDPFRSSGSSGSSSFRFKDHCALDGFVAALLSTPSLVLERKKETRPSWIRLFSSLEWRKLRAWDDLFWFRLVLMLPEEELQERLSGSSPPEPESSEAREYPRFLDKSVSCPFRSVARLFDRWTVLESCRDSDQGFQALPYTSCESLMAATPLHSHFTRGVSETLQNGTEAVLRQRERSI